MCLAPSNPVLDPLEAPSRRGRAPILEKRSLRRKQVVARLTGPVAEVEDVRSLEDRAEAIRDSFRPRNGWQDWLASAIAVTLGRIDRVGRGERAMRDHAAFRAIDFWEDDQALAVEMLGSTIAKGPGKVVAKLQQTPAGCNWLIARWRALAKVEATDWTEEQRSLAGSLLGGDSEVDPMALGLARGRIAELVEHRGRVEQADAVDRSLVEAGLEDSIPSLARLRGYERSLQRRLEWYVDQFHAEHPGTRDETRRKPILTGDSPGETKPTSVAEAATGTHRAIGETKPTTKNTGCGIDETKPFEAVEPVVVAAPPATEVLNIKQDTIQSRSIEYDRVAQRKRRIDPARELARLREKRRRSA